MLFDVQRLFGIGQTAHDRLAAAVAHQGVDRVSVVGAALAVLDLLLAVKLLDFGLAKLYEQSASESTAEFPPTPGMAANLT